MPIPAPQPGLVISYSYLWRHEQEEGRDEGIKDRPCAIVLVADMGENTSVLVVPVTHTPPGNSGDAIEIPSATKRRLGLDDQASWIVLTEVNKFIWPGPDLRPIPGSTPSSFQYGYLPPALFGEVRDKLVALAKAKRLTSVPRDS